VQQGEGVSTAKNMAVIIELSPPARTPISPSPSAYLHRHVAASGFRDGPFSVSGRASLCSLP
jgi:hypothetical protein